MGGLGVPDVRPARPRLRGRVLALPRLTVRPFEAADLSWAEAFLAETLGGRMQARRGELIDVLEGGPGCGAVAHVAGRAIGLITWLAAPEGDEAEVRALAVEPSARRHGAGRALLDACDAALRGLGVGRAWLVTTNDNLAALALYQKAGWRLSTVRVGALDELRRTIKPSLPTIGQHGIPFHDELELEKDLRIA